MAAGGRGSGNTPGNGGKAVPVGGIAMRARVTYPGIDDLPIHFANTFLIQKSPDVDEWIITFGHLSPPVLLGSEQEQREQAQGIKEVPAKMIARFGLSQKRLEELISVFDGYVRSYKEGKLR